MRVKPKFIVKQLQRNGYRFTQTAKELGILNRLGFRYALEEDGVDPKTAKELSNLLHPDSRGKQKDFD